MKLGLNAKLAIGIVAGFGILTAGYYFWKPLNITYYKYKIGSENKESHLAAVKYLLEADAVEPVKYYYENRYASKDVKERLAVVDELCAFGDHGKTLMYEIFRNRCMREQVLIPAGSFMMGSENSEHNEKPVHNVTLDLFRMDKYEVTNEKYYVFIKCTNHVQPEHWKSGRIPADRELHPVVYVRWGDAEAYAKWLKMRLPTEAEWEYACRAGSTSEFCFGDNALELEEYAWFGNNSGNTHPVGLKKPNKRHLYDIHGNVWEWCQDWYDGDYYIRSPKENPKGPSSGGQHIFRGGSWHGNFVPCRSACRCRGITAYCYGTVGFRVCRSAGK
jgi:formylglycine-generating enzyme required for sulfatase activity